ncbi:ABC transporter ATP-binding protein [Paraburkholderia sp.]|uniref:ABC transporter ATP-binding protein n=1 Tax=Paraburkholderia sp. TaxID=1926495 RepID=UPI0039E52EFD
MPSMLEVSNVWKRFDRAGHASPAVAGVSFRVEEGEFVSIVGSSGCGKSTLLNIIAGLVTPDSGQVAMRGVPVTGAHRSVGYTFQQPSLLPWRTVCANVELGLELRGVDRGTRRRVAMDLIEQVGLAEFSEAYPHQLSGGMAKRAEIVRVLAIDPELLLMDEPFGALDAQTKIHMQNLLLHLLQMMHKTVIFITHDLEEAVVLSDRVITMAARPGRVIREHPIILDRPRDSRTARLDSRFASYLKPVWEDIEPLGGEQHAA